MLERPGLALATISTADAVLPLRVRYRQEMNCQIVHDSIHRRDGWTVTYMLNFEGVTAGFGSIALAGPWKERPSIFEFYVLPQHRAHSFKLFEALLMASNARFMEVQSSDALLAVMLHTFARFRGGPRRSGAQLRESRGGLQNARLPIGLQPPCPED